MSQTPDDTGMDPRDKDVRIEITRQRRRRRRPWVWVVVAALVLGAAGYGVYYYLDTRSDSPEANVDTDPGVVLPQNPSLSVGFVDGVASVTNDGNVTMSSIEVQAEDGSVLCALGVLSPGESAACPDAPEGGAYRVVGSGPQGQPVEVATG